MGFYEDDRIRNKNAKWNFPTPEINEKARAVLTTFRGTASAGDDMVRNILLHHIKNPNDDPELAELSEVYETALKILDTEV